MSGSTPPDRRSAVVGGLARADQLVGELSHGAEQLVDRLAPAEERDLIRRALDLSTRKKLLLARRLWTDPRVRDVSRLPIVAGGVYLLLPIKLLPARFGPLRQFEKLVGLGLLLWLLIRLTPDDVLREHLDAIDRPGFLRRAFRRE